MRLAAFNPWLATHYVQTALGGLPGRPEFRYLFPVFTGHCAPRQTHGKVIVAHHSPGHIPRSLLGAMGARPHGNWEIWRDFGGYRPRGITRMVDYALPQRLYLPFCSTPDLSKCAQPTHGESMHRSQARNECLRRPNSPRALIGRLLQRLGEKTCPWADPLTDH